jgi:hypothetical protein
MTFSQFLRTACVAASIGTLAACSGASATSSNTAGNALAAPAGGGSAASVPDVSRTGDAGMREVTLPAGTQLPIVLDTSVGSDTSRVEEPVHAHLAQPVDVHGVTLGEGSRIGGVVTDATRSGKVKGLAHVGVRFDSLTPEGSDARYEIHTAAVGRTAENTHKKDALEIGGGAAGGAIIGALIGGGKGAAIGTAAGGGAGTAVVLSTRGKETHIPRGSRLTLHLTEPVTIRVRG